MRIRPCLPRPVGCVEAPERAGCAPAPVWRAFAAAPRPELNGLFGSPDGVRVEPSLLDGEHRASERGCAIGSWQSGWAGPGIAAALALGLVGRSAVLWASIRPGPDEEPYAESRATVTIGEYEH